MKRIILFTLILGCIWNLRANDTLTYKNDIRVSISSGMLEFNSVNYDYGSIELGNFYFTDLNYSRMVNDFVSTGGYLGYGQVDQIVEKIEENIYGYNNTSYTIFEQKSIMRYGLNGKLHILPLILKAKNSRLDFYLSADIGLISIFTSLDDDIFPKGGTYFEYSVLGGAAIFLFKRKRIGFHLEAGYRDFKYHHGSNLRAGIAFRF